MDDEKSAEEEEGKRRIQQSYSYRLLEAGFRQLFEQARREGKSLPLDELKSKRVEEGPTPDLAE